MTKFIKPLRYILTAALFVFAGLALFEETINPYKFGFFLVIAINNAFLLMFEDIEVTFGDE